MAVNPDWDYGQKRQLMVEPAKIGTDACCRPARVLDITGRRSRL